MAQFSPIECLSTVYPIGEGWVGKTTSGQVKFFQSLADYQNYLNNLARSGKICPDVSVPVAPPPEKTTATPFAYFMEFLPRNPEDSAKYSAMSSSWQGQQASQQALDQGKYRAEEVFEYKANDRKG